MFQTDLIKDTKYAFYMLETEVDSTKLNTSGASTGMKLYTADGTLVGSIIGIDLQTGVTFTAGYGQNGVEYDYAGTKFNYFTMTKTCSDIDSDSLKVLKYLDLTPTTEKPFGISQGIFSIANGGADVSFSSNRLNSIGNSKDLPVRDIYTVSQGVDTTNPSSFKIDIYSHNIIISFLDPNQSDPHYTDVVDLSDNTVPIADDTKSLTTIVTLDASAIAGSLSDDSFIFVKCNRTIGDYPIPFGLAITAMPSASGLDFIVQPLPLALGDLLNNPELYKGLGFSSISTNSLISDIESSISIIDDQIEDIEDSIVDLRGVVSNSFVSR